MPVPRQDGREPRAAPETVFRKIDGQWMVLAHGNFASIE
jgi:hypothetical protein